MINTKSVKWSEVSEESKREQWRLYHIYNTFNAIFFGDTFNSQDSIEEAEVTGGHQWVYTWNNPSEAPESTENGILEFPVFTKEHYSRVRTLREGQFRHVGHEDPPEIGS